MITLFGFITANKGYELTIRSLPDLPSDVVLLIAGGTQTRELEDYPAHLLQLADSLGVKDRVRITGFVPDSDVPEVMAASSLVLTPHTHATGSYSVMVPLSYGKAVVASDLAVFREIQERGDCLRLFPSGDLDAYREALRSLLADESAVESLEKKARHYAENHSWTAIATRTVEVYEKAISDAAGRS